MQRQVPNLASVNLNRTPFVAIWETTRACDLACRHCRAEAISSPLPGELTTDEGLRLLDELADMGTPICVLSGGDPAKRGDLLELVRHGAKRGMRMGTIPAATPLLTRRLVFDLKEAGLAQMALSLDGPSAEIHDSFRGVPGAFDRTMAGAEYAWEADLPLQINTVFSTYNWQHFDAMAEMVRRLGGCILGGFLPGTDGAGTGTELDERRSVRRALRKARRSSEAGQLHRQGDGSTALSSLPDANEATRGSPPAFAGAEPG